MTKKTMTVSEAPEINDALNRLAGMFTSGALQADTDCAAFLNRVADEVAALRAKGTPAPSPSTPILDCGDGVGIFPWPAPSGNVPATLTPSPGVTALIGAAAALLRSPRCHPDLKWRAADALRAALDAMEAKP